MVFDELLNTMHVALAIGTQETELAIDLGYMLWAMSAQFNLIFYKNDLIVNFRHWFSIIDAWLNLMHVALAIGSERPSWPSNLGYMLWRMSAQNTYIYIYIEILKCGHCWERTSLDEYRQVSSHSFSFSFAFDLCTSSSHSKVSLCLWHDCKTYIDR
jgi:hypothetical protein